MEYVLKIRRTRTDVGYVTIEADNPDEALRKYWEPDYSKGEDAIFDDEIEWESESEDYDARVIRGR